LLEKSLPADIAWYGHLPRDVDAAMPERHLGLLPAAEIEGSTQRIERMADALAPTPPPRTAAAGRIRRRAAPTFAAIARRQDHRRRPRRGLLLPLPGQPRLPRTLGATLTYFSPLADAALPECDAVWLPGGYPELHGPALAANRALWQRSPRTSRPAGRCSPSAAA
jgi:cobyrinic acid a,c-diamide synthase